MSSSTITNNANNNTNTNNTTEQQDTEHNNNEITDNNNENNNNEILTYKNAGKVLFQLLNLFFIKFPNIKELGLMLCKENPPKTILELKSLLNYFNNSLNLENNNTLNNNTLNLENLNLEKLNLENINLENNLIEEPNRNVKTAFPFLYKDNRIGLSFWALPFIYEYAYHELLNNLKNNLKNKENENENLNNLTRAILVISADCYSAWNVRKELLLSFKNCKDYNLNNFENNFKNFEEKIKKEFELMDLVLSKHPKSCETWEHRTWVVKHLIFGPLREREEEEKEKKCASLLWFRNNEKKIIQFFNNEMEICLKSVVIYPRNYYAWTYRQKLINLFMENNFMESKEEGLKILQYLLKNKLDELLNWFRTNISDHSCVNHLIILMKNYKLILLKLNDKELIFEYLIFLLKQFYFSQFLIIFFPGHETLWVFRRFLWFFLLENYNLYENYFTIDSLQNCLMDLSEFAFELYKHSSLESKFYLLIIC